jgi:hypothetical protein
MQSLFSLHPRCKRGRLKEERGEDYLMSSAMDYSGESGLVPIEII